MIITLPLLRLRDFSQYFSVQSFELYLKQDSFHDHCFIGEIFSLCISFKFWKLASCRAIISSPITKWNLPYEGMIRRPARSHPRYRPSLRRASTRRVFSVCLTSTRSYVRTRTRVCVTRVFTRCPRHPYQCWSGRSCTVSHGRHVPVTAPEFLTSSRRRRWPRQWWYRTQLSWNTDNHPLLVGGHPDRSPTFLAHALDTFNQIPHARDSVNAKSPPFMRPYYTIFTLCSSVLSWNIVRI